MADVTATNEPRIRSRTFAALANPDYRKFYLGQGVSLIGTWLQAAAVSWIVFDRTQSERMSGLVEAAGIVPGLAFGVVAGAIADRFVPRTVILLSQVAQMILAFGLAWLVTMQLEKVWHLAVIVAMTRVFVTLEMPARQVFLLDLVGRSTLMNAIALNSGLFNASRVVGPAMAGACLSTFGEAACFALNGASYLAAIGALLMIRLTRRRTPVEPAAPGRILGGFTYLIHDVRVRSLYLLMTAFGIVGGGFSALGPSYARNVVGTGKWGYSLLLASGGIGATIGALGVASIGGYRHRERFVLLGIVVYAAAMASSALVPPIFGPVGSGARLAIGSMVLFATGVGAIVFYATTQTMIQSAVPDALRGRIMGIWMIVYSGSVPLGCLWEGELAQAIGVRPVLLISSALCGAIGLVGWASGRLVAPDGITPNPGAS